MSSVLTSKIKRFWILYFSIRKTWYHSISFLFQVWLVFFTPLCVRGSGWPCLSSFRNFLILKIWFYLPCKKCCYWCTVISLVCNICFCCFLSIHILFSVLCLSLCIPVSFAFVRYLHSYSCILESWFMPLLLYALSVCLIRPCNLLLLLCALMQFSFT